FYWLMLPLLVLLFIAIGMRIGDYGFTLNRYLVLVLGIWLAFTCVYFILPKGNIKFIPISLAVVIFLASFGPWGVFKTSENSQVKRLHALLSRENFFQGNKLSGEVIWNRQSLPALEPVVNGKHTKTLPDSLYAEVASIIHYLDEHHGFQSMEHWFSQDLTSILQSVNQDKLRMQKMQESQIYMETLGLDYGRASRYPSEGFYSFQADLKHHSTPVHGYDFLVDFNLHEMDQRSFVIQD